METIGLNINDMTSLMVRFKEEVTIGQEATIQSNTAQFISAGCTEDEARFRAGVIGMHSIDTSVVLGIMVANNRRILSDLKEAGILKP